MNRAILVAAVCGLVLAAGVTYPFTVVSTTSADTSDVEVAFGVATAGVTVGANATNASATLARSTVPLSTTTLWLNNTNASGTYHAKISLHASSGALNRLTLLEVGIDNGTRTPQVTVVDGNIGQTSGSYVNLEPGSANRIYVTQDFTNTGGSDPVFGMTVRLADAENETAYTVLRFGLTLD